MTLDIAVIFLYIVINSTTSLQAMCSRMSDIDIKNNYPLYEIHPLFIEGKKNSISRILLIINYRNLLDSLTDFLTEHGFFVYGVSSAGVALEVVQCVEFDLIICDNYPPDIRGMEMCRQIREVNPHIKFILMSGFDDTPPVSEAHKEGIIYVFRKPINLDDMLKILTRLTSSR